ncbi:dihydrofolate reductase family protein [Cellulomonas fimi]|uniref:dihydrofolate reductase family protein n=1 Tax=Cellulomonas fimi TaxID=1708 RepID=UPI00234D81FD|nr:dihydrofolate reductase family protein [Cellulomonas fimi]MDC7120424.1 dihydrofolate reductase family protein [Cellulomonas fimi]
MGKLIYSMFSSLDGYAADADGSSDWGGALDPVLHDFVSDQSRSVGTYLYGRRMYETMSFWETALDTPDPPDFVRHYAEVWQAADKVVYSTTLDAPTTRRTTVERTFDPAAVRAWVDTLDHDVTIDGPTLAAHALRAGIVDEVQPYVAPVSVGGGLRFWPDDVRLDLDLVEQRAFGNGTVWSRYAVRRG